MNEIEKKYHEVITKYKSGNFQDFISSCRNLTEQIIKTVYKSYKPNGNVRGNNLNTLIKELEKREVIPLILIPHARNIQTFGNHFSHNIVPSEIIKDNDVEPAYISLNRIFRWYKDEFSPSQQKHLSIYLTFKKNGLSDSDNFDDIQNVLRVLLKKYNFEIKNIFSRYKYELSLKDEKKVISKEFNNFIMLKYPHLKDRYIESEFHELLIKLEQEEMNKRVSDKKITGKLLSKENKKLQKIKSVDTYWSSSLDDPYRILINFTKVKKK